MTGLRTQINLFLVGLCASYLTLGVANAAAAEQLWWLYAIVSGALALVNLVLSYKEDGR